MNRTASILATLSLSLATAACSSGSDVGSVDLNLTGVSTSGNVYRLRSAMLTIASPGTSMTIYTDGEPDWSIHRTLPADGYVLGLLPGWTLERVSGGFPTTVSAVLTSNNPQAFEIREGETTYVALRFRADGNEIPMGHGNLDVVLDVDDGVAPDGGPTPVDGGPFGPHDAQPAPPPDAGVDTSVDAQPSV